MWSGRMAAMGPHRGAVMSKQSMPHAPLRPRESRGLTMVEILVTVAILSVIVVALAMMLRESPARRCLISAQGLAAWLQDVGRQ